MVRKFFIFLFLLSFFLLLPILSSCTLVDAVTDHLRSNDPKPAAPPYHVEADKKNPSPQFQAEAVDSMVTAFTMNLVMNGASGSSVKEVQLDIRQKKNSSEAEKALQYGKECMYKLFHSRLLFHSPVSTNILTTFIEKRKWYLSLQKGEKVLFTTEVPLKQPSR